MSASRPELERALSDLAAEARWPPTPPVAEMVASRLTQPSPQRPARARPRPRRRHVATALGGLVAAAAVAASPVGAAAGRLLGIAGGERVQLVEELPGAGARLDLGRRVTLAAAGREAGFPVHAPAPGPGLGSEVRIGGALGPRTVTVLLADDTILSQTPGTEVRAVAKLVGPQTVVRQVSVAGAAGVWIARGPRVLRILDARHRTTTWRSALPGSGVLLWERDGVALRLETRRPLAAALRLAREVA